MWFKTAKLCLALSATVSPTTFFISTEPNEVRYFIEKEMVKRVKYNDFQAWSRIPWNSAYFDIDQPDLKLIRAGFYTDWKTSNYNTSLDGRSTLSYESTVAGVKAKEIIRSKEFDDKYFFPDKDTLYWNPDFTNFNGWSYDFNEKELNDISRIMFNHNFISKDQRNNIVVSTYHETAYKDFTFNFTFEVQKPLSFYIQSFMFYFSVLNINNLVNRYEFSFLDYEGNTRYSFEGVVLENDLSYNFITMPVRVPNLKYLNVRFWCRGDVTKFSTTVYKIGQMNVFSSENIAIAPPSSPFSPEQERVSWWDVFGYLRNFFRWCIYGVVGSVLPVEPLRYFFTNIDSFLRSIFDDTISAVLNVDFTTGLEQVLTLSLFLKACTFLFK